MLHIMHHNDLDGHCAAAIAAYFEPEYRFYEATYNDVPKVEGGPEDILLLVDFSIRDEQHCAALRSKFKECIILDHHVDSFVPDGWRGKIDVTKSGALLTWEFYTNRQKTPLAFIRLVNDYDLGRPSDDAKALNKYIHALTSSPSNHIWTELMYGLKSTLSYCIDYGHAMLNAELGRDKKFFEKNTWVKKMGKHKVRFMNARKAPYNMKELETDPEVAAICMYTYDGRSYRASLYAIHEINLLEEFGNRGFKGHAGACGAYSDTLDFIS